MASSLSAPRQFTFLSDSSFLRTPSLLQHGNERQRYAWKSLLNTAVLEKLGQYDATLVGTIPLDVDVSSSDLDIVCMAQDLSHFERVVVESFGQYQSFEVQRTDVTGEPTLIARFHDGVFPYEIFCQSVPVNLQNGYLHLFIEDVLLEIGGARARIAIRNLKAAGIKTEPAFAKYFGIAGDPYKALRELALDVLSNDHQVVSNIGKRTENRGTNPTLAALELTRDMKNFCREMADTLQMHRLLDEALEIDHACYRVASLAQYEQVKNELSTVGDLLSEAFVNGRPISTYRLREPIDLGSDFTINAIELPAPKSSKTYATGFEHVEVVIKGPLEEFMKKYPELNFDLSNLNAEINRDVSVKFETGLVKFHEASLEQVIAREKAAILGRANKPVVIFDFDDTLIISKEDFTQNTILGRTST